MSTQLVVHCGATDSPCEGAFEAFSVPSPISKPLVVAFGTAVPASTCTPNVSPVVCTIFWTQLNIMLTPTKNACPSGWVAGDVYQSTAGDTTEDVHALWIGIQAPTGSSFVGTYVATSDPWDGEFVVGGFGPFIVSAFLPKGANVGNDFKSIGANGTIVITKFIADQEIVGNFDAVFSDGTHLVKDFDVPLCTAACFGD